MKKPESKKKFILSTVLMITLIIGCIMTYTGIIRNMRGFENPWMVLVGFCIAGISTMILCSGTGELFKLFFTTLFGKDKK